MLDHPATQSLAVPAGLAVLAVVLLGLLRGLAGRRGAALGVVAALLLSWGLLPGYHWPPGAAGEKLPWVVAAAAVAAGALAAWGPGGARSRWWQWGLAALAWAAASGWVAAGRIPLAGQLTVVLAGAGCLLAWMLAWVPARPPASELPAWHSASAGATLAVIAFGLAGLGALGGSLLLAQLAAMLGSVCAVLALGLWLRPAAGLPWSPAVLMPLALAWLVIALALRLAGGAGVASLLLLASAGAAPLLAPGLARRRPRWAPWGVAAVAALLAAAALGWQALGAGPPVPADDDPYYEPAPR